MLHFSPWLFQLTETICTDPNRFQSTGEKAGTYTGSLYRSWFLTKILSMGWAWNQGLRPYPVPTVFEILVWVCIESMANIQKTRFHHSVKKQEETCKGSNMSFIKLTWSWYVWVYMCVRKKSSFLFCSATKHNISVEYVLSFRQIQLIKNVIMYFISRGIYIFFYSENCLGRVI